MTMNISDVSVIIGAMPTSLLPQPQCEVKNLQTDSRSFLADAETLFFALTTPTGDGHNYIADLYARGVRNFVVEHLPRQAAWYDGANFLVVPSPLKALQTLGAHAHSGSRALTIAITGSRGKTVIKEWLTDTLGAPVRRSPRSYNSQIGVPLSLWETARTGDINIIEAGISRTGEMEVLRGLIKPDMAVITCLTAEHAEGFASRAEMAAEKMRIARGASTIIYPYDDIDLRNAFEAMPKGERPQKIFAWSLTDTTAPLYIDPKKLPEGLDAVQTQNYCTLLATLTAMEKSDEIGDFRPYEVQSRISVSDGVNDCLLAHDTFTCDEESLPSALDFLYRRTNGTADRREPVLILYDLKGQNVDYSHVAELVRRAGVRRFIGIGRELTANAHLFPTASRFFVDTDAMLTALSPSDFSHEFIMVKGHPQGYSHRIVEMLEARTHETVLEVNLDAIVRNFNYFRSKLPATTGLIAMVKASGYGAGSLEIAKTLQAQGAAYLAVAVLDEGIDLRAAGITMPIMVMNPKVVNYRAMFNARLEPEIYCFDMLYDVIREADKAGITDYPIHIKLDTGMHRMGFNTPELPELLRLLNSTRAVRAATLFSHLATADCLDMDDYTQFQLDNFERMTGEIMAGLPYPVKRHLLNTAGILRYPQYHYDFARLGIGLYGVATLPPECEEPLSCVSTLRTVVIAVKERKKGETIGYGRRGVLERDSRIATIPIGYADGMNRHFGRGAAHVLINGTECPTVGNICMDACMIDVTDVPGEVRPGDAVQIFGPEMPVQRLADILDTIPYEVLTAVSPRVKRVYYRE